MDLSIRDLILKPETAGPGILKPSAQGAGEAASLAAFNNLLGHLGQTQQNIANRLSERDPAPLPRDPSPVSNASSGPTHADDYRPETTRSQQSDTARNPSQNDEGAGPVEASAQEDTADPEVKPQEPTGDQGPVSENHAPDVAAPAVVLV